MNIQRFVGLVLALLLSFSAAAQIPKALVVGYEHWPPFQWQSSNGVATGLDIEAVKEVLKEAGFDAQFVLMPWTRIERELANGRVDIALAAVNTKQRQGFAWFSKRPLRNGYNALFVRHEQEHGFVAGQPLQKLLSKGMKLAAVRGVSYSREFESLNQAGALAGRVVFTADDNASLQLLLKKRVDGFLAGEISGTYLLREADCTTSVVSLGRIHNDAESPAFLMISKASQSRTVVERIDQAMSVSASTGALEKPYQSFLEQRLKPQLATPKL